MILFTLVPIVPAVSAFTPEDAKCSFATIQKDDLVCICMDGTDYHSVIKEKLSDRVILLDFILGEYVLTAEEFDNFCIGKEFNGEEVTPPDGQSTYAVEVPNDKNLKEIISVWIHDPFWSHWKWAYGTYWVWYSPDGETHYFIELGPAWHMVYGLFKINYWHVEQKWCIGTLPWNYVKTFTPNPTYEHLHYDGEI